VEGGKCPLKFGMVITFGLFNLNEGNSRLFLINDISGNTIML
jgi:hypothetical protein